MKKFISLVCALALIVGCMGGALPTAKAAESGGNTYYVSISGKGGNNGLSQTKPLPGLDAVPWDQLLPGDSVLLKKGDTFPGAIRMVDVHGEEGNPVTIGTYGTGDAPVVETRGQGIWLPKTGNGNGSTPGIYVSSGVTLYDCSYITVEGLTIVNIPDAIKTNFDNLTPNTDDPNSNPLNDKMNYFGVGVAATNVGPAEGITLTNLTVRGNSEVQAVKTDTSTAIVTTGVTLGAAATARTFKDASGTYYVSSRSGSDSNDGSSPDKAFYSLHKINELNLQPGAKVYLECGSAFENQYLHIEGGGSAEAPIIIDSYGNTSDPKPVINTNGEGVWYQNYRKNLDNLGHMVHGYVSSCILLYDVPYIEVKNIAMTNYGTYGQTVTDFPYIGEGQVDGGTVPGETGYNSTSSNTVGCYQWGGKMSRTGVGGVAQNKGTITHTLLQNLDIENIYGNVFVKHMDNGGIYFTAAYPLNESATGISRYDDLRIEGCYLKRVSRWGIAAVHTAYWHDLSPNGVQAIPDEACQTYGSTNVYIGHNYLEEVGGDVITLMHAYEPLTEYNVGYRGGREGSGSTYHSGAAMLKQTFSAGIWPWKCKTAIFEHNECYGMLNSQDGNGDAQAWDADSGDATIYQYNYSSGNTGGCIMYCLGDSYNSVFRYNISFEDGSLGSRKVGPIDMSGAPNGQIYNNLFLLKEGVRSYYRAGYKPVQVWNNIFYNMGSNETFDAEWDGANITYKNNVYSGFGTKPSDDVNAIEIAKTDLFAVNPVGPRTPKVMDKVGTGNVNGVRNWTHNWAEDFDMFKLDDSASDKVVNRGNDIGYTGLTQDADFGVPRVANDTDFYGNELDAVHDIGAFDTQTEGSRACQLFSSLYELRGTNNTELQVPFTANNPLTVEDFAKGLTISEGATVKVYNGNTEVTDNVATDMTVKIVAQDGVTENPTTYTIKNKNTYNHSSDWINNQQGNVWFQQYRLKADNQFYDWGNWNIGGWYGGNDASNHAVAEQEHAGDDLASNANDRKYIGSGFTFRAPATGTVTVGCAQEVWFRSTTSASNTFDAYLIIYRNGTQVQKTLVTKGGPSTKTTIPSTDITVARGDTIEFMIVNEGDTRSFNGNNNGVTFNPVVTYKNEAVTDVPADTKAPTTPLDLRAKSVTENSAKLSWSASTDNVGVDHYAVTVDGAPMGDTRETGYLLTGLEADTEYTVTVKAVDAANNESGEASATFRTAKAEELDEEAPSTPQNGRTVSATSTTATIAWDESTDNVGVDHYVVQVHGETIIVRNINQVTISGLDPSAVYTVLLNAWDAAGNESGQLNFTCSTTGPDTQAPTVPTNVRAAQVGKHTATVRWDPSEDNEVVAGYEVKLGADGDEVDAGDVLQYALTDLEGYTDYTAYVRAYDAAGNTSGWASVDFQTTGSSECEIIDCFFEISGSQLKIPYTDANPLPLEEFQGGFKLSEDAVVKVYEADGTTPVTTGNVVAGMVVKIVAQDGTVNPTTYTTVLKETYNSYVDWGGQKQGNVWFYQHDDGTEIVNFTAWDSTYSCWGMGAPTYKSVERNQACGSVKAGQGSGFTFRAPTTGMVQIALWNYKTVTSPVENQVQRRANTNDGIEPYIRLYIDGKELTSKAIAVNKNATAQSVQPITVALQQGEKLSILAWNGGDYESWGGGMCSIFYTPVITYLDQEYKPDAKSIELSSSVEPTIEGEDSRVYIYTNTDPALGLPHTTTLTATVLPEGADQTVTWASNNDEVATVEDGVVTAVKNGTTNISATTSSVWGDITANITVEVRTRMESITVKQGGVVVGSDELEVVKVYVNKDDDHPNSVDLTTEVTPDDPTHPELNWVQEDGSEDMISLDVKRDNNTHTARITAEGTEVDVGEVNVRVESMDHPEVGTEFKVHVFRYLDNPIYITGEAKVGSTLTASTVDLVMTSEGKDGLRYQWYLDSVSEEHAIEDATDKQYVVGAEDIGHKLVVTATADETTFYEGTVQAETEPVAMMAGPAAPTGLTAVNCTDGDNGQITGLKDGITYEYKLTTEDDEAWREVTGPAAITDLAAGTYQVRIAETTTQEAGKAATVTIMSAAEAESAKTITVDEDIEGGTIELSATQAVAGTSITVTLTPDTGYELEEDSLEVTYTDEDGEHGVDVTDGVFEMPEGEVSITAKFKKMTFTIIHIYEGDGEATCDLPGEHPHTVEYGYAEVINLTAGAGYTMPSNVTVTYTEGGAVFRDYEYSRSKDNEDTATLTFTNGVTANLTVTATLPKKVLAVGYTLKNGLTAPTETAPRKVEYGAAYEGKLVAEDPTKFKLPLGVTITMDGEPFTDFDYDSDTGIITIAEGKITGNLMITAEGLKAGVPVKPVTGVTLDKTNATVQVGKSVTLTATVAPGDATDRSVVWQSGDTAIATVEDGVVTGVSEGETTITVTTVDGGKTATCTVTVTKASKPSAPVVVEEPTPEVKENEDGSTTTTVTAPDGTVTETTEKPDGSTEVVETKPDGTVTETKTDAEGAKVEKVTDPEENVTITATDSEGEVLAEVKIPAVIDEPETRFEDVPEGHWADEAIHKLATIEVVNGVGGNKYDMEGDMTRGALATVLHRLSNKPAAGEFTFDDVDDDAYYAEGVAWAEKTGVVKGFSASEFRPEQTITREQLALMLLRYAKLLGMDTKVDTAALDNFADGANTHDWAAEGVAWCVQKGILQGKGGGKLDPTANVTRAQVAVMVDRFIALMK